MTLLDPKFWLALLVAAALSATVGFWRGDVHRGAVDLAQQQKDELAAADQRREDEKMQRQASAGYQAQLQKINARAASLQGKLHDALTKPIPTCPATVGAVVVPAAAIDSLRAAGANPAP